MGREQKGRAGQLVVGKGVGAEGKAVGAACAAAACAAAAWAAAAWAAAAWAAAVTNDIRHQLACGQLLGLRQLGLQLLSEGNSR